MLTKRIIFCVFFLVGTTVDAQRNVGDSCQMQTTNAAGTCVELKNCPAALASIQISQFPQICGFLGSVPIVCCEKKVATPGELSKKKCWEYGEAVYELVYPPIFVSDIKPINESTCTLEKGTFITGGVDADAKEFPHMALLGYGEQSNILWRCGGTLISNQFVLTAGHCLHARELGMVKWLRLGDLNVAVTSDDASPEDFSVKEIIRNPEYKPPSRYNDIALLKMDRPVEFSVYIRPACLHTTEAIPREKYIATGWGLTVVGGSKGSEHLQKVGLDEFSQTECNSSYASTISARTLKFGIVPETQFCAGGKNSDKDTCQGDSGGPLQIYHPQVHCMYSVIGVTSFGKTCGIQGIPGVYTRVSKYIDWIEKTVWPEGK